MAEPESAAVAVASLPSSDDLERAASFAREPFLLEGEEPASALAPGTPRRKALDAALVELDEGAKVPSTHWRRRWSLLLGLDRILSQDEPALVDGTVLSAHQVDALSGTLTALLAESQRNGNGRTNGAVADEPVELAPVGPAGRGGSARGAAGGRRRRRGSGRLVGPGRGRHRGRRRSQRREALLVRARDRRRQDGGRARLRRGLAHRRPADPHPPPQPRRPVPRRAARPRLRQADLARRCWATRTRATAPSPSRPTSGSSATRARSPTPTRSSSATRRTPRWARRRQPRSAPGPARCSSA